MCYDSCEIPNRNKWHVCSVLSHELNTCVLLFSTFTSVYNSNFHLTISDQVCSVCTGHNNKSDLFVIEFLRLMEEDFTTTTHIKLEVRDFYG